MPQRPGVRTVEAPCKDGIDALRRDMFLTLTTTHQPATDLGYLLHKNPGSISRKELTCGEAVVFYPEATAERCTAVLLVEVDPVRLVRGRGEGGDGPLAQYVNDRPYVASSFLSVAIAEVFGTALNGRSKERQDLAETPIALEAHLPAVNCRGGGAMLQRFFQPLGYEVTCTPLPLDDRFPSWGPGILHDLRLKGAVRVADLLRHLYVLLPAIDAAKHYWVGRGELAKLLAKGETWLASHPEKESIVRRYLHRSPRLAEEALERLAEEQPEEAPNDDVDPEESLPAPKKRLNRERLDAVTETLLEVAPDRILDLGCGEGKLLQELLRRSRKAQLTGMDVSTRALEIAAERLDLQRLPPAARERLKLIQGSLLYADDRLAGFDAAALVEVIEHLEPGRLRAMERVVFERARPRRVVVTTPNAEYNVRWETLPAGNMRHSDHRFEWTRPQFQEWATSVASRHNYTVAFRGVGESDPEVGTPTQMAVFDMASPEVSG